MEDIRTYAVGNGEITLTAQDAEDLRIILQTRHIKHVINELIDAEPDLYRFPSKRVRSVFVNTMVGRCFDLRDIEGCYAEMVEDDMLEYADKLGIRG